MQFNAHFPLIRKLTWINGQINKLFVIKSILVEFVSITLGMISKDFLRRDWLNFYSKHTKYMLKGDFESVGLASLMVQLKNERKK